MTQWSIDYCNKNDNWTITPLSHIPLIPQYYFFSQLLITLKKKQVIQRRKYKRGVIKVHVRP